MESEKEGGTERKIYIYREREREREIKEKR